MNRKEPSIAFSDRELKLLQQVATERGVTVDEAASELMSEAIASRFRIGLGRLPAKVYSINTKRKP